jgi:hypothetical protein
MQDKSQKIGGSSLPEKREVEIIVEEMDKAIIKKRQAT